MIVSILQLENEQLVSEYSSGVIKSFEEDVLPIHFGLNSSNRNDLIQSHTAEIVKSLFASDDIMFICDGMYARHKKSTNNEFQRKSYFGQKKVPLCKPFTICTTDGYIVDMLGPYYANVNDAEIIRSLLDGSNNLYKLLKENDYAVLDRDFCDVTDDIEKKIKALMLALKGKRKQCAVHGTLKQKYKMSYHKLNNKRLPKVGVYFTLKITILIVILTFFSINVLK